MSYERDSRRMLRAERWSLGLCPHDGEPCRFHPSEGDERWCREDRCPMGLDVVLLCHRERAPDTAAEGLLPLTRTRRRRRGGAVTLAELRALVEAAMSAPNCATCPYRGERHLDGRGVPTTPVCELMGYPVRFYAGVGRVTGVAPRHPYCPLAPRPIRKEPRPELLERLSRWDRAALRRYNGEMRRRFLARRDAYRAGYGPLPDYGYGRGPA